MAPPPAATVVLRLVNRNPDGTGVYRVVSGSISGAAVIFDGGNPRNVRTDRPGGENPIDNTRDGIVQLGTNDTGDAQAGVYAQFSNVLGGDGNAVRGGFGYGSVVGGFLNRVLLGSVAGAIAGGAFNQSGGEGSAVLGGEGNLVCGDGSLVGGGGCTAFGDFASATGENTHASGLHSMVVGQNCVAGYEPVAFTIAPATVNVTIPGVDAREQFANGEQVKLYCDGGSAEAYVNSRSVNSVPVYAAGDTTFDLDATLDDPLSSSGTMASRNKGEESIAFGFGCVARSEQSIAGGTNCTARDGFCAMALGYQCTASGPVTLAIGSNCKATGAVAVAIGSSCVGAGAESVAIGDGNKAVGQASLAGGNFTRAFGRRATAAGESATASGYASTVFGKDCRAGNEPRDFTIGAGGVTVTIPGLDVTDEFANGNDVTMLVDGGGIPRAFVVTIVTPPAFAAGDTTFDINAAVDSVSTSGQVVFDEVGEGGTASGIDCVAAQSHSTAMGGDCIANSGGATAFGIQAQALGQCSTALGATCTAAASFAQASGFASVALGFCAVAVGQGCQSNSINSFAGGFESRVGNVALAFTLTAGDTTLHFTGDVSPSINAADTLSLYADGGGTSLSRNKVVVSVTFPGVNPLETDVVITTRIDAFSTSGFAADITTALGNYGFAYGYQCVVEADGGVAMGTSCNVLGNGGVALGTSCTALGVASAAIGDGCVTVGDHSLAQGETCVTFAPYSRAAGRNCQTNGGFSEAVGEECLADGDYGSARGYQARSFNPGEHVEAAGQFSNPGDAQTGRGTFKCFANGAPTPLLMLGLDKVLQDETTYGITVRVTARNADQSKVRRWTRDLVVSVVAGVITAYENNTLDQDPNAAGWTLTITDGASFVMTLDPVGLEAVWAVAKVEWEEVGIPPV